eukprot:m.78442 g.78442  ORF g.78442 m.78442 type:complete len:75 (-) comp12535_c0_seq1:44-268(-)
MSVISFSAIAGLSRESAVASCVTRSSITVVVFYYVTVQVLVCVLAETSLTQSNEPGHNQGLLGVGVGVGGELVP